MSETSNAGSGRAGSPKPARKRVSHRKELAVVTLAAVASIAGVGGFLAAHQPVTQNSQPASTVQSVQRTPVVQTTWHGDDGERDDGGQAFVQRAQGASSSFSTHSHAAPSAVSQGSVAVAKK